MLEGSYCLWDVYLELDSVIKEVETIMPSVIGNKRVGTVFSLLPSRGGK